MSGGRNRGRDKETRPEIRAAKDTRAHARRGSDLRTSSSLPKQIIEQVRSLSTTHSSSGEWSELEPSERALHMLISATRLAFPEHTRSDREWEAYYQSRIGTWLQGTELHLFDLAEHLEETLCMTNEEIRALLLHVLQLNSRPANQFRLRFPAERFEPAKVSPTPQLKRRSPSSDSSTSTKELQTVKAPKAER